MLVEPFDSVGVREAKERTCWCLEVRVEMLDEVGRIRVFEKPVYCLTYLGDNEISINV
jgi:hypothetical protein